MKRWSNIPQITYVLLQSESEIFSVKLFSRYLATASSDHTVKIWNVDGFTLERTLVGKHCLPLLDVQNSNFVFTGTLINVRKLIHKSYSGHQRWVWDCVFSVDGAYLITGKTLHRIKINYQSCRWLSGWKGTGAFVNYQLYEGKHDNCRRREWLMCNFA